MPRAACLAVLGPPGSDTAAAAAHTIRKDPTWREVADRDGVGVWTTAVVPMPTLALPDRGGLVIGDLFPHPDAPTLSPTPSGPEPGPWATWLTRHRWGRYIAILTAPGRLPAILRDPSGLVDALLWPLGEAVHLLATDLTRVPADLWPRHQRLNWDRIAAYMGSPSNHTSAPLFDGMRSVGPGDLLMLDGDAIPRQIWRPRDHLPRGGRDATAAGAELVRRVDACTDALASAHGRLLVEVSGGLDSSIVAASLHATGHGDRVGQWLNRSVRRAEGDERAYARAVTERVGATLTCLEKPVAPLTIADLMELAAATWPAMNGVEASRDRDAANRLLALEADGLVSGQGGDAIFFQPPTALVIADAWRVAGPAVLGSRLLPETARRTRQSVWAVLRAALRAESAPPPTQALSVVRADVAEWASHQLHAWTADALAGGAPPAKLMQVQMVANHHIYHGDSRRRRVADEVFPLLAQPVIEHCLSIPVPDLVRGGGDRPFARAAFASRLPDAILQRRGKGGQSAHFAQVVAASLPELRPFLLEGNLVAAGILDRTILERQLDPQFLITHPGGPHLMWAAAVEAWVRHWQTRIPDSPGSARWNR